MKRALGRCERLARLWCLLALLGCVFVGTAAFVPAGSGKPAVESSPLLALPLSRLEDCGTCSQGGCWSQRHKFDAGSGPDRAYEEGSHGCSFGWCGDAHPSQDPCGLFAAAGPLILDVWKAAVDGGTIELAELVAEGGELVAFNPTRRALQVKGCNGDIVLSIPLSADQSSYLSQ